METFDRKQHWDAIYQSKALKEVSWFQSTPQTSLDFLHEFRVPLDARIIDIGGGDSYLVDHLLREGYRDITVLDISETSIERAKLRLGTQADKVTWIVADAANFEPKRKYDFWHDRAAFHFLTSEPEIAGYLNTARQHLSDTGILVVGTFSEKGPEKCSGITVKQYSETTMTNLFERFFQKIRCITVDHQTPFNTIQNFIFCSFRILQTR